MLKTIVIFHKMTVFYMHFHPRRKHSQNACGNYLMDNANNFVLCVDCLGNEVYKKNSLS